MWQCPHALFQWAPASANLAFFFKDNLISALLIILEINQGFVTDQWR